MHRRKVISSIRFNASVLMALILCMGFVGSSAAWAKGNCNAKGKGGGCPPTVEQAITLIPLYFDDFEVSSKGWSPSATQEISGDRALGGYCNFSTGTLQRTYLLAPEHRGIRIRTTVHLLDRWEGESAVLEVDGQVVWSATHHHCSSVFQELCNGINVAGDVGVSDALGIAVDLFLPHTADTATLSFSTGITRSPCEASLAVDDVELLIY